MRTNCNLATEPSGGVSAAQQVSSSSSKRRTSVTSVGQCQCGCRLTDQTGHIIAPARHRCMTNVRRWTIIINSAQLVSLSIDYFHPGRSSSTSSLTVYDTSTDTQPGTHVLQPLLELSGNGLTDGDKTRQVIASGNRMFVEYVTSGNDVSVPASDEGFIATYTAVDESQEDSANNVSSTWTDDRRYTVLTFWDSQVAVVGMGLCAGVILASLSFVCYERLALRRLRAKQDTQTPSYRALVASKQKHDPGIQAHSELMSPHHRLQPRSPRVTNTRLTAASSPGTQTAGTASKLSTASPVRLHVTPSASRRQHDVTPVSASPGAANTTFTPQLSVFQPRTSTCKDPVAVRSRSRSKSPREAFECICLVPGTNTLAEQDTFVLETRPPVEGRDSLSVDHVLDDELVRQETEAAVSSIELKTATYVGPTETRVAVRRRLERTEPPGQVTRGTSPMTTSDVDILPDCSGLLTSGTETDEVDDVLTMTGAGSSSSLSDLVAGCDAEFDSDEFNTGHQAAHSSRHGHHRLYKVPWSRRSHWTANRHQCDATLEPDVYYC